MQPMAALPILRIESAPVRVRLQQIVQCATTPEFHNINAIPSLR